MSLRIVVCLALVCCGSFTWGDDPPEGFRSLFNGQDLTGWHGMPPKLTAIPPEKVAAMSDEERKAALADSPKSIEEHWKVVDGAIVNDGGGDYLVTDDDFEDYELLIDYKTVPLADSGIYLKGMPQVQIWDYTKEGGKWNLGADKGSGGLWNNSPSNPGKDPLVLADKPFGEWNHFRILQVGSRTSVWLNDKLVVDNAILENIFHKNDDKRPIPRRGPILLQTHGGEIQWRNIAVREIPPEEANKILREKSGEGFTSLFNGTDLTGWQGAIDQYEAKDGILRCQARYGANLFTEKEYGDFVVRLEYKLPPAGNNGLAIRYPGEGDPAYAGMCEIQILDDGHPNYQRIDARQANGSVYGAIPAHRGYLRPTGEWNFLEATVKGPEVSVELNGYPILQGDVSQVTEFLGNRDHSGLQRTSGHFGLAGHADPVEFRGIEIKELTSE